MAKKRRTPSPVRSKPTPKPEGQVDLFSSGQIPLRGQKSRVSIVPIPKAESLEEAEDQALAAQFVGSQEFAEAYLYAYPDKKLGKNVIGPNVDFVRQIVRQVVNRGGKAVLDLSDDPPVVEDIVLDGAPGVRVITSAINRKTGERKWGVVEEPRNNRHAAYIALQKAERRALEGHPAYDRKRVATQIKRMLVRQGLNPDDFIIAGASRTSVWAQLYKRAREKGVSPDAIREGIRTDIGKGLSEVRTAQEVSSALKAADKVIAQPPKPAANGDDPVERERLRHHVYDAIAALDAKLPELTAALRMQFGKASVEDLSVNELGTFAAQLQRKLQKKTQST